MNHEQKCMNYSVAGRGELGRRLGEEIVAGAKDGESVGMIGSLILFRNSVTL